MTEPLLTRRRAMMITAAAAGGFALGSGSQAHSRFEWRGTALGARGKILIAGFDRTTSRRLVRSALGEVERLERIFSLYRPDSEISRLNATGRIRNPSHDMRILLGRALRYWRITGGAFNPAVQPLWQFLADHFAADPSAADPDPKELKQRAGLCDPARIRIADDGIRLEPGMALTFNGIAQGYITDAVADLLRSEGLENVLVQLGELRALPGQTWRIAIQSAGRSIDLANGAIATSQPAGTVISANRRWHHLIDPRTGRCADGPSSVTVAARNACLADALSTALAVSGTPDLSTLTRTFPDVAFLVRTPDGDVRTAGTGTIAFAEPD